LLKRGGMRHLAGFSLLLLLAGCPDGGFGCGGSGSDPGQCPVTMPADGSPCDHTGHPCFYADACTQDPSGIGALCHDGQWLLSYDEALSECPAQPPRPGDPCPCVAGGRQSLPCSYDCVGGTQQLNCDEATETWVAVAGPATCLEKTP
jgi:hypothetical protein